MPKRKVKGITPGGKNQYIVGTGKTYLHMIAADNPLEAANKYVEENTPWYDEQVQVYSCKLEQTFSVELEEVEEPAPYPDALDVLTEGEVTP